MGFDVGFDVADYEKEVHSAIDALIERMSTRMFHEQDEVTIAGLGFAIDALIELEHTLGLCDNSDEVYEAKP